MDRIRAAVVLRALGPMSTGCLAGCASTQVTHATTRASSEPAPAAPAPAPANPHDFSTAAAFTDTALVLMRQAEAEGGWSTPAVLKLTNTRGLLVNLERIYAHCEVEPTSCEPELQHLVSEVAAQLPASRAGAVELGKLLRI